MCSVGGPSQRGPLQKATTQRATAQHSMRNVKQLHCFVDAKTADTVVVDAVSSCRCWLCDGGGLLGGGGASACVLLAVSPVNV